MNRCKLKFPPKDELGFWIKTISITIEQERNRWLSEYDITSSQFEVMIFLHCNRDEELSQVDIENGLGRSNPTISGILKRMESKGLVERLCSEKDRRFKKIVLSKKGIDFIVRSEENRERMEDRFLENFSDDERDELIAYLKRVYNNMTEEAAIDGND
ncbi:MAG: MarR family transcriptional regulator [Eubacterium sp.]|nr:MarR family transcriptional regulator [Eubacterium sp.]